MESSMYSSNIDGVTLMQKGKVRDMYDLGDSILMVATDRLSAFDVVMPQPIPQKGKVLTQISLYWYEKMRSIVNNHLITADVREYPEVLQPYAKELDGRSMIVKKAEPLKVECVVRGYISGSGWKSYKNDGTVCGISLPQGLKESDRLPEPLFTPSTKADLGDHDINISFEEACDTVGEEVAKKVRNLSLAIYSRGVEIAAEKGIIIADTKFEFGLCDGELILIDEVLTPDSSRFWPKTSYKPGGAQESFDKQFVRDYLERLEWDKTPPGPSIPEDIIEKTSQKYQEALALFVE
ncbi:MAG: phosphoribosylaminoimidazolesuccinocarboxamide synthase [Desulfobacterales bacterium]|nr:phosphoribosylaminoimidazolesuccinocarboxamide synthase [Desulfobacterales bacterium]